MKFQCEIIINGRQVTLEGDLLNAHIVGLQCPNCGSRFVRLRESDAQCMDCASPIAIREEEVH